ncbi:MAG: choice-of-anchor D domain-containing protein [bacterium]
MLSFFQTSEVSAQAGWTQIQGPQGYGPILAAGFLNEQFGIIQTRNANWFRTTDGGTTWQPSVGLPTISFTRFVIYFYTPAEIYINGRYESLDSGKTWHTLVSPAANGALYIKAGIFYDASGRFSTDHANSWTNISAIAGTGGVTVVGNLDDGIAVWDFRTGYTTDGGKSWQKGQIGVEADYGYSVPFTSTYFRAGGDGRDAIQRSTDGGLSWQMLLGQANTRYLSDGIGGDGCVVFAQAMATVPGYPVGVIRSTDLGATWVSVGGPMTNDDMPLCGVCSRGAVCYAMGYTMPGLWKYTDQSLRRPVLSDTRVTPNFPDEVTMRNCDSLDLGLLVEFSGCDFIRLHKVSVNLVPQSLYSVNYKVDAGIYTNHPANPHVIFKPSTPGTYHLQLRLTVYSSDWTSSDIVVPITVIVTAVPPRLKIAQKNPHDFGTRAICLSGASDTLILSNSSCEILHVSEIKLDLDSASTNDFSLKSKFPYDLSSKSLPDTLILKYDPKSVGIKGGKIILLTSIGNDTIPFYANALPDSSKLVVEKNDSIIFPTKELCDAGGKETILISNPGCIPLRITKISFETDSASKFEFGFKSSGPVALTGNTPSHILTLDFLPLTSGAKSGKIIIESDLGNDTIEVRSTVLPDGRLLLPRSNLFSAPLCDSVDGILRIKNYSCREMTFNKFKLDSPFRLLPIRLPVIIRSGDSALLPIRFIPVERGFSSKDVQIEVSMYMQGYTIDFDTSFIVQGFASHGRYDYSISAPILDFTPTHLCDSTTARFALYSSGCDSLPLSAVTISGDNDFQLIGSTQHTSEIASGDSLIITVRFAPELKGKRTAVISLLLHDSVVAQIPVSGDAIPARKILLESLSGSLDFGAFRICDTRDTSIMLTNTSCDPIQITEAQFVGRGFGSDNTFPITIPPGESRSIHIHSITDTIGLPPTNIATLQLVSDADTMLKPLLLSRSYIYAYPVHLWLSSDSAKMTASGVWKLRVKGIANELSDVRTLEFGLQYDMDMLEFVPEASTVSQSVDSHFRLASQKFIPASDSTLGVLAFKVYLTKDLTSDVLMHDILLNSSDNNFMYCTAIPQATGTQFNYDNSCGDPTLRSFMRGEKIGMTIKPNPSKSNIVATISVPSQTQALLSLYDVLGEKIRDVFKGEIRSGEMQINTTDLRPGIYYLRMEYAGGIRSVRVIHE